MILLRNAHESDLNNIHKLAVKSGIGLTTLPKDRVELTKRIERAATSFNTEDAPLDNAYYLFVLEDTETKALVGTSAIEARSGGGLPFYTYKVSTHHQNCENLNIQQQYTLLTLSNGTQGLSELCTLFLTPSYRKNSNGLLLSKARFLFIANNPSYFTTRLIAEIRGVSNKQGRSPFWEALGRHFFNCSFADAVAFNQANNRQLIADLMPQHPIYAELLPCEAQESVGIPHHASQPAMHILHHEGFVYNQFVDLFDAGPTVEVERDKSHTLSTSEIMTVKTSITPLTSADRMMIANTQLHFRALHAHAKLDESEQSCLIHQIDAKLLNVKEGDSVRIAALAP